ncbi:MAG: phosphoglycerate kinase, partial [Firmicutes bacterium]|nr:phosphoglycerate kinase [Bacillota bacterium]
RTVERIEEALSQARTILWNGPLGVFEWEHFAKATMEIARMLATIPASVVVGGGDSAAAVCQAGIQDRLAHVSTGGGATLQFLEGKELVGLQPLFETE